VNLHVFPHVIYVIGIAPDEPINGSAVIGIDDEYAAAGRLTVVSNKGASGDHVHAVCFSPIKMNAVIAIEFRARLRVGFLVGSMHYKQHGDTLEREISDNPTLDRLAYNVGFWQIVLQKLKVAGLRIFRKNTKPEAIADSYSLNRVAEVVCEFNAR
jgi:hypothetical protein